LGRSGHRVSFGVGILTLSISKTAFYTTSVAKPDGLGENALGCATRLGR
jgi:hypothetical protein